MNPLQEKHFDAIDNAIDLPAGKGQETAATSCFEITKEFAVGFAEWAEKQIHYSMEGTGVYIIFGGDHVTMPELFDLYIESLNTK